METVDRLLYNTLEGAVAWLAFITGHSMDKIIFGACWGGRAVDIIHSEHLKLRYEIYTASD